MKKLQMQKFVGAVLFTSLCAGLVLAQPLETPSNDPAAVDAVKQVAQDMGGAMVAGDIDKLMWFENGPIDVKVFGDMAVSQGSVKEKRTRNGKDTSGQFLWMDLLKKRAGKWAVVRSAGARVVSADSPK